MMTKKKSSKSPKVAAEAVPLQTLVSVLPSPPRRSKVPNRIRMRNRQMPPSGVLSPISEVQLPDLTHRLTPSDECFFRNILNPCDERSSPSSCSKIPDGGLPNSGAQGFREVLNVAPPFNVPSTPGPLGGPVWNLVIMKIPTIRMAGVLIAFINRDDLSIDDQGLIADANNSGQVSNFPVWYTVPGTNDEIKMSYIIWTQLRSFPDLRLLFKQVRIGKSGFTTFHNAPDLYNQGMLITAQWNCDFVNRGEQLTNSSQTQVATSFNVSLSATAIISSSVTLPNGIVLNLTNAGGDGRRWTTQLISPTTLGGVGTLIFGNSTLPLAFSSVDELIFSVEYPQSGSSFTWQVVVDRADGTSQTINQATTITGAAQNIVLSLSWAVSLFGPAGTGIEVELPPLDSQTIIQSTPKAVVYPLKQYNGAYTPLRFWEPVFNNQEANNISNIVWRRRGASIGSVSTTSPFDVIDLNFGTAVQTCLGMSFAASITVKFVQDIEFVAGDDSPWMGFMEENINVDTQVISMARAVVLATPFAYPQTFNSAGILGGLLSQFLSHVPILSNVVPVLSRIVNSVFPSNGSSDNQPHPEVTSDGLVKILNHVLSAIGKQL